ncbi:MAG TPA: HAMP domain-containing sensor histidine kinase [Pelomicrobium sp.]|nr:HAMP domain-containing sensor histidine kinase [Pelomicrobium sp.]
MAIKWGLRARVALTIAVFSLLLVTAQTATVIVLTEQQEDEVVTQILDAQLRPLQDELRSGATPRLPFSENLQSYLIRTPAELDRLPAELRGLPVGTTEFEHNGKELHVEVRQEGDARLILVYDATPHEQRVHEFRDAMLLATLAVAIIIAATGYWLAGLLVSQVGELAQRVSSLAAGDAPPAPDDYADAEVATLASAFAGYHDRTAALLAREKEFTADASHELRTPLTAIQTGGELLAHDPNLGERSRARVESILQAAARMDESIRALLLLARETAPAEIEAVNVREAVEEAVAPLRGALERRPEVELAIEVAPHAVLQTQRAALALVVANLVKNALAHTRRGAIRVTYDGAGLSVTDTGSGIRPEDLPRIFERHFRGADSASDGSGLGLAIVQRIADRFGWQVTVASEPGRGSTFRVVFLGTSQKLHNTATPA